MALKSGPQASEDNNDVRASNRPEYFTKMRKIVCFLLHAVHHILYLSVRTESPGNDIFCAQKMRWVHQPVVRPWLHFDALPCFLFPRGKESKSFIVCNAFRLLHLRTYLYIDMYIVILNNISRFSTISKLHFGAPWRTTGFTHGLLAYPMATRLLAMRRMSRF